MDRGGWCLILVKPTLKTEVIRSSYALSNAVVSVYQLSSDISEFLKAISLHLQLRGALNLQKVVASLTIPSIVRLLFFSFILITI